MTTDLNQLSDFELLCLAVWREASNQPWLGWIGVAHVIKNRVLNGGWWGDTYRAVILHPYQFSSFNANDPNRNRWPDENEEAWTQIKGACFDVYNGVGIADPTDGATFYWSSPLTVAPHSWGKIEETFRVGSLHFCKPAPIEDINHESSN